MTRVDRDELLSRVDLPALADELLGPRRGRGAYVKWPCPVHQPQTGRTPPLSAFVTPRGEQRWHCHACGAGGTAIDLVIAAYKVDVRAAIGLLASRAAFHPIGPAGTAPSASHSRALSPAGRAILEAHVTRCQRLLWHPLGHRVNEWLHRRGFTDETLRRQRVGADPGPRDLDRPRGLPWRGPAAIFPVLASHEVVYYQARYLDPARAGGRKYDNPVSTLAANPRLAILSPAPETAKATVFVCEGMTDALSVRQAGHPAVAVLGAGLAGPALARQLLDRYPDRPVRVAFDTDARGRHASAVLLKSLHDIGHPDAAPFTPAAGLHDLNDWLRVDPRGFGHALQVAASLSTSPDLELDVDLGLEL